MTDRSDIRAMLLDAFAREGIDFPRSRLPEAIEDCAQLHGFLALIRADAVARRRQDLEDEDRPHD